MRCFLSALLIALALPVHAVEVTPQTTWIADPPFSATTRLWDLLAPDPNVVNAGCCKTCSKGYACGDSCISRSKQCHKGPGCACDG